MIYLFDKDEKLIKIVRKSAVKTALQKYSLTTERYVSDRLTVELKGLNADKLEQIEYMAIQTMEDAHTFHYFYVAQKSSDELTALIGVQSGIEELRKSPVYDKRPQNALARDVITDLLAGTNWQARFVGETTAHSTNFYYTSVFDALKKVCDVWDLEMQFFVEMNGNRIGARYIDFKQRIGEAVGKRVVYGHNALQILQEVERTNIYTALVGRGKGEESGDGYGRKITFENVVWSTTQGKPIDKPVGQKYLELPLMTSQYGIKNVDGTMRPKIGFVDFSEEENPEVLIERTYKALVDAARPQLTLKTSSVYLKEVKVGDTIRVVRHDKRLDYDTRIFEITFNRLNNKSSDIKLGDRIGESNEAKAQTIADKAVEQFVNNEFSNFVQNLPDYLPSADGFNNNWYGAEDPNVKYPGKVLINDIWYKSDPEHEGHKIMLRWTGEVWEEILRTYDSEALRDRITEEIAQVNQSMQAQSDEHDRQVADILSKTQSIETLANQAKTDAANAITTLHNVTDTVDSHTRTIGAVGTSGSILDNVSKVTQTAAGLVQEVSGSNGLKTQVSTLAGSYAIKNLTKAGDVLGQINLNPDGSVRINEGLISVGTKTYIQDGVISSAKIASLDAGKITTGTLDAARIATNSITGSHIVFDQAFFNNFMANEAYLKQIFAKTAFITSVQAVAISASQIYSGIIKATSGAMVIDLDNALTEYKERATIRFHSAGNVLYREKRHPSGHNTIGALMFKDSNGGGVMTALGNTSHQTIDTMRNNYGEGGLTGSFAGVRVVRDNADTQRDRVDIIADRIIMAHSTNFQESTNSGFYFYPTAVNGWWNLGAILQNISNKFNEHGWGKIGDIYNLGYAGETTPSQYT